MFQAKKEGCEALKGVTKFGLSALFEKFLPGEVFDGQFRNLSYLFGVSSLLYVAHRALPDVEAVVTLFKLDTLHGLLPSLTIQTPQEQIHQWSHQKQARTCVQRLVLVFGN